MIKASHLTKRFDSKVAIRDVSFEVAKGEVVGFLGPNGAGKTTTMRILCGFIPPTQGSAWVSGFDVFEDSLEVRKRIGYLPENNPLYLDLEVNRFLDYIARLKKVEKKKRKKHVDEIMEKCGLGQVKEEVIKKLSKGFRQRVGFAQALIGDPEVLILDEPTIGLDPKQIKEIRELIRELGKEKTIILSTHILPEVSAICSRVIIINEGEIVATDTPERLTALLKDKEEVLIKVRGPRDQIVDQLKKIKGVKKITEQKREKDILHLLCESAPQVDLRKKLAEEVVRQGWDLLGLEKKSIELEDIFLKLITKE